MHFALCAFEKALKTRESFLHHSRVTKHENNSSRFCSLFLKG